MKALLIDDHPLILSALEAVMKGLDETMEVLGVPTAAAARVALAADSSLDLVLLDLQLADADGFDLLAELRATYPALPIVVVSASERSVDALRAIDLGAMGYVPKCVPNETLLGALRHVLQGGIYMPPMIMRSHVPGARQASVSWGIRPEALRAASAHGRPFAALGLTPRQTEVLNLLLKGQPNKLIARELKLSVETVKDHVAAVLRTLNVSSRTQAVLAVSQMVPHGAWRDGGADARHGENPRPVESRRG